MSSKIPFSGCSLNVFVIVIVLMFVLLIVFCWPDHHCDQMSQSSKVSKITLWRCSLNVFVIVFVFVFLVVFLLVRLWFRMTPINFARFRFGLEGWKDVNQEQWIGHNSHKGRLRVARAAKNIMTLWFDSDWTWNCDDLQDPLPPLVGTQAPQQLRQLRCIWSTNNMTCASGHQYILQIGTNYVDIETMGSTSVP